MCEPTTGACECAPETTTTTRRRGLESRPCECGNACGRTASGGHRLSRTCRAEAPVRAELARKTRAHRDEVQAYRTERGEIVRFLASAGVTGASPVHAAKMAATRIQRDAELRGAAAADAVRAQSRMGAQTARANRAERDTSDALARLQEAHAERDDWQSAAKLSAADLFTARADLAFALEQRDDARTRGAHARATAAGLTTRLRLSWGVAALLGVALLVAVLS